MAHPASGDKCKFYLSPLHIKFSLIKISVQAIDKWKEGFDFWKAKISKKKFDQYERSHFRLSTNYTNVRRPRLSTKLNCTGGGAWTGSEHVCRNFLGNEKAKNYRKIVRNLISWNGSMGCNVSLKLLFLDSSLDFSRKHGSRLGWTWWNMPPEYSIRLFDKLKRVTVEMESKFVGWLLLESYKEDTNWRK